MVRAEGLLPQTTVWSPWMRPDAQEVHLKTVAVAEMYKLVQVYRDHMQLLYWDQPRCERVRRHHKGTRFGLRSAVNTRS